MRHDQRSRICVRYCTATFHAAWEEDRRVDEDRDHSRSSRNWLRSSRRAYDEIATALENGELVGLFPEGRLTSDGEIGTFRNGIARIVHRTPVPVVPLALSGLWESLFARRTGKLERARLRLSPRIRVAVGESLSA
jgi:1-acyl-sn-glycerol-3-phosphate acyltransferase